VYNIGDQDQSQLLNNIINETYNPAGQHNYIYDQQVQYMVHGTWYMVHGTWYMVHGTWYMVHGTWYMVHANTASSQMYMYQQVHGTRLYNIYTYVYVPTGTWYMLVQHLLLCICNKQVLGSSTKYSHMYMYQLEHGARIYNIYIYAYVLIGTWYMQIQHLHKGICTNRYMVHVQYLHIYICTN